MAKAAEVFPIAKKTIARLIAQDYLPHLSITITSRNASGVADAVRFALDRGLTFSLNFFRDNECAADFAGERRSGSFEASAVCGGNRG